MIQRANVLRVRVMGVVAGVGGLTASATAQCSLSFAPGGGVIVGDQPREMVGGDFNGDGRPDLAVVEWIDGSVRVMLGNGAGSFAAPVVVPGISGVRCIAAADMNNDGLTDLLVGTNGSTVVVLLRAMGSFIPLAPVTVSQPLNALVVKDFDQNGTLDVVGCAADIVVTVPGMPASPSGLGPAQGHPLGGGNGLAVGDLNGDGRPDLVKTDNGGGVMSLLSMPGFMFSFGGSWSYGPLPQSPALADINGDGKLDLVFARTNINGIGLALGNGAGSFGGLTGQSLSLNPATVRIGDFNQDGRPDVLVNAAVVLPGLPGGGLGAEQSTGAGTTYGVVVADFNLDGREDFAQALGEQHTVQWRLNTSPQALNILQQPQRRTVAPGEAVTFNIGATAAASFQWRRNGVPLVDGPTVGGATAPMIAITGITLANDGDVFDCVLTNACGSLTSVPVSLLVREPCGSSDFNGDGDFGTDADIEAFFRVLAGGGC